MNLSVAIGMNQDAVFCSLCAAHRFINDVVVVPACQTCDRLGTDRAGTTLLFPQVGQGTFSLQGSCHLYAKAFFQRDFPCRVIGITPSFDFLLAGYWYCGGVAQPVADRVAVAVFGRPEKVPVSLSRPSKVPVSHPPFALLRVSPSCPSPQGCEEGRIHMDKGFFGRRVSVEVRPSSDVRVELCSQPVCGSLFVVLDDLSDAGKKRLHVFLRGACQEVPLVLTYILSEKVTSVLNGRYAGLLCGEFQSSCVEKLSDEWFDFRLQHLLRDTCDEEVIRITDQVDLLGLAFERSPARVWILLSKYPFQAIQRHIGKDGRANTTLRRTIVRRIEDRLVHVSCFQPGAEDGCIHRDRVQQPWVAELVKAGLHGSFKYPVRPGAVRERDGTLCHRVGTAACLPQPVRVWVGGRFCHGIQSLHVQRLHGSIFHRRETQGALCPVWFRDRHAPQWEGLIPSVPQFVYGHPLTLRVFPRSLVNPWSVLAWVFCHASDGKGSAAERVGEQGLQGWHLVPRASLRCLNDTCLQPTHRLIDRFPWDGMPVCRGVGDSTSREFRRHLHRPLDRFVKFSRQSTPQGSLPACASGDVATRIRPTTGRPSLFPTPIPASPLAGLTTFLPFKKERYGLTTFRTVDKDG